MLMRSTCVVSCRFCLTDDALLGVNKHEGHLCLHGSGNNPRFAMNAFGLELLQRLSLCRFALTPVTSSWYQAFKLCLMTIHVLIALEYNFCRVVFAQS
jgi:hypothetical protein